MNNVFSCCRIDQLLKWIIEEEKTGQVFGIHKDLFFTPHGNDVFKMERYGEVMETPLGVAAGPHTQLSQNIISAWLTGARYTTWQSGSVRSAANHAAGSHAASATQAATRGPSPRIASAASRSGGSGWTRACRSAVVPAACATAPGAPPAPCPPGCPVPDTPSPRRTRQTPTAAARW